MGLEPTRHECHKILSLARLPIPTLPRTNDIIAKEDQTLVFVEVKYRKDDKKGYPAQAVDQRKQQKIRKSAMIYLKKNHLSFEQPIRFDVVEILGKKIRVIKHAF